MNYLEKASTDLNNTAEDQIEFILLAPFKERIEELAVDLTSIYHQLLLKENNIKDDRTHSIQLDFLDRPVADAVNKGLEHLIQTHEEGEKE